jgi:hypothetical protein
MYCYTSILRLHLLHFVIFGNRESYTSEHLLLRSLILIQICGTLCGREGAWRVCCSVSPPNEKYIECLCSCNLVFIVILVINVRGFSLFRNETLEMYHETFSHSEPQKCCSLMNCHNSFHILVFWVMMICIVVGGCQHFWGTYCQPLYGVKMEAELYHPKLLCNSVLSNACHMPRPFHQPVFNHRNHMWLGLQIITLLFKQFSPVLLLPPNSAEIFYSALCCPIPPVCFIPLMWKTNFHNHTKQDAKL